MRVPSEAEALAMSRLDLEERLERCLKEITDEIDGLQAGHVWTTNGLTKGRALANARRRLSRLEKVGGVVGVGRAA